MLKFAEFVLQVNLVDLYPTAQGWGGRAWIHALYVNPESRRKGLGRRLLTMAEEIARKEGHKKVSFAWPSAGTPV